MQQPPVPLDVARLIIDYYLLINRAYEVLSMMDQAEYLLESVRMFQGAPVDTFERIDWLLKSTQPPLLADVKDMRLVCSSFYRALPLHTLFSRFTVYFRRRPHTALMLAHSRLWRRQFELCHGLNVTTITLYRVNIIVRARRFLRMYGVDTIWFNTMTDYYTLVALGAHDYVFLEYPTLILNDRVVKKAIKRWKRGQPAIELVNYLIVNSLYSW